MQKYDELFAMWRRQNDLRTEIATIFAICDYDAHRRPQKSQRFPREEKAMLRFKGAMESR